MRADSPTIPLPHERYAAYHLAVRLTRLLDRSLSRRCRASLRDQVLRASDSVVLNIAEGSGRAGKDRLHFFRIARGSACEVAAGLELLESARGLTPEVAEDARRICGSLYALLSKMAGL